MLDVRWTWLFLDVPTRDRAEAIAFWSAVSATTRSPWRGDHDEFTTLEPAGGPAWLKLQLVGDAGGVHLDLDVDDPDAAARIAVELGAQVVARPDHVVLASPGGFPFCLTHADPSITGPPRRTGTSLVDQVCLDIPPARWDDEATFWSTLLGWPRHRSRVRAEFDWLERPDDLPVRILLQRLDGPDRPTTPVRGHVDLASVDRPTEVARHEQLGATVLVVEDHWTVLTDPVGRTYCVTDRDPATATLPG